MMKDNTNNLSLKEPELPKQLLDAKRNHGGMTVPDDFFAQFERKMNAVIDAEVLKQQPAVTPAQPARVFNPYRWITIAATVIVVAALGLFVQRQHVDEPQFDAQSSGIVAQMSDMQDEESAELTEQLADEMLLIASDYDVYDLYCDL